MDYYHNKVCLIAGAASGTGDGLVQSLAERKARVVVTDIDQEPAVRLADQLNGQGHRAHGRGLDVRFSQDSQDAVGLTRSKYGRLDLLVNNAGVGSAGELRDVEVSDRKKVIDVNLCGGIRGVHACLPVMVRQGFGQIVKISSACGLVPRPGMIPYATSKPGVVGLSNSLRVEAEDLGIRVNVVCPFNIATPVYKTTVYKNLDYEGVLAATPLPAMSIERCVRRILKRVRRNWEEICNWAGITVHPYADFEWWCYRFFPPVATSLLRRWRRMFRKFRTEKRTREPKENCHVA